LAVFVIDQQGGGTSSVSNMVGGRDKDLPSFWIPSLTPESSATTLQKPVNKLTESYICIHNYFIYCPFTVAPLAVLDAFNIWHIGKILLSENNVV